MIDLARGISALILVVGLIFLLALLLRRVRDQGLSLPFAKSPALGKKQLRLVEQMVLDQRRRLVLVSCHDRHYLLLLSPSGETVVDNFPRADGKTPPSFADALQQSRGTRARPKRGRRASSAV